MKIENTSADELKKIFEVHTGGEPLDKGAKILTDKWTGYSSLKEHY